MVPQLTVAHFEKGMWLTDVTNVKQTQDAAILQLISKLYCIVPFITEALRVVGYISVWLERKFHNL